VLSFFGPVLNAVAERAGGRLVNARPNTLRCSARPRAPAIHVCPCTGPTGEGVQTHKCLSWQLSGERPAAQFRSRQIAGGLVQSCAVAHRRYTMHFFHTPGIWSAFPSLRAGVMHVHGVRGSHDFDAAVMTHTAAARARLGGDHLQGQAPLSEGQWPEIQAWRRVYADMGLQPTQVRCAAEALLRRLRQDGQLPRVNPLVDLCNAVSVHASVPIAIFDCAQIVWPLSVTRARGDEEFLTFSGETEHPAEAEVVFVDGSRRAHARKWAHRQSKFSAVSPSSDSVLIVIEAFHEGAPAAVATALRWLEEAFSLMPGFITNSRELTASNPDFPGH